jgi:hypothetical protein
MTNLMKRLTRKEEKEDKKSKNEMNQHVQSLSNSHSEEIVGQNKESEFSINHNHQLKLGQLNLLLLS